jgi:hypothetical protein
MPKLLIPDIKGSANVVLESGHYYPHHNLYFVTSNSWDLPVLQMILSSRVAHAFIAAYSPRMRGNFLRFQAQYLRRICIPRFEALDKATQNEALSAARSSSPDEQARVLRKIYRLNSAEWAQLDPAIVTA